MSEELRSPARAFSRILFNILAIVFSLLFGSVLVILLVGDPRSHSTPAKSDFVLTEDTVCDYSGCGRPMAETVVMDDVRTGETRTVKPRPGQKGALTVDVLETMQVGLCPQHLSARSQHLWPTRGAERVGRWAACLALFGVSLFLGILLIRNRTD